MFRRHLDDRSLCPIGGLASMVPCFNFQPSRREHEASEGRVCTASNFTTTSPSIANGLRIMTYKPGYGTS
jgi:hypothetical protein